MAAEQLYSLDGKRVWIAGHNGMVGSAIHRQLAGRKCTVLTVPSSELDLRRQADVERWVETNRPDVVIVAAARVGGIYANSSLPADFIYDNMMIEANVIHSAFLGGIEKLLFLGSTCIFPREAPQPTPESALLTGQLEPTNQWYAIAKIAGIKLCESYRLQHGCDFISAMPTNLYGPGDNFHPKLSHVLPALLARIDQAKATDQPKVTVWGSGTPRREFLYVDDCADALIYLLEHYSDLDFVNVGTGIETSIRELAETIGQVVAYNGQIEFDVSQPDGAPRRLMDVSRMRGLGWQSHTTLKQGIEKTYDWYRKATDGAQESLRGQGQGDA